MTGLLPCCFRGCFYFHFIYFFSEFNNPFGFNHPQLCFFFFFFFHWSSNLSGLFPCHYLLTRGMNCNNKNALFVTFIIIYSHSLFTFCSTIKLCLLFFPASLLALYTTFCNTTSLTHCLPEPSFIQQDLGRHWFNRCLGVEPALGHQVYQY